MRLKDTESDEFKGLLKGWNTGKDVNVFWNLWSAVQVFLGPVAGAEGPTLGLRLCCCLLEIPNTFILEVKGSGTAQQPRRPGASTHMGLASLPPLGEWDCLPFSKSWLQGPSNLPTLACWMAKLHCWSTLAWVLAQGQSLAGLCPWCLTCGEMWWPSLNLFSAHLCMGILPTLPSGPRVLWCQGQNLWDSWPKGRGDRHPHSLPGPTLHFPLGPTN